MNTRMNWIHVAVVCTLALGGCNRSDTEAQYLASAQAFLAKKDTKSAVVQLKNALQQNPDSAQARQLLGKALLALGEPAAAWVELNKARVLRSPDEQIVPELARALLLLHDEAKVIANFGDAALNDAGAAADLKTTLSIAYTARSDPANAERSVAEALRLRPDYVPAQIVQARLYAAAGRTDDAVQLLDAVLAADAGNDRAGTLKAEIQRLAQNDPQAALATVRRVLATNAGSIAARAAAVGLLLQLGRNADATTELAQLKKLSPSHPETLFLEARSAFAQKNDRQTREIADRILKAAPHSVRVLELAGAAEYRMNSHAQAQSLLTRALKLSPGQPMTRLLLAQSYLRSAQPDKTIDALRPLLNAPKVDGAALALAGEAYLQLGDTRRSEEAFQRALKLAPADPRLRTSVALAEYERGETGNAIDALESVARTDSGPRADLALVSARLRRGDDAGALKAIDALQKKLPDKALPHHLRGQVQWRQKDVAGAAKSFEAASAREPQFFPAVAGLAGIDLAAGRPEAARKRFDAFLQSQPNSIPVRLALAELGARTGTPVADGLNLLRQAVKIDPSDVRAQQVLVTSLITAGDAKGALLAAQQAAAALPDDTEVMDALGRAELAAGDTRRAIATFKRLTALQPKNALPEVRLADAHLAANDHPSAARSLRRAVELQPDFLQARRNLVMLALLDKRPDDALAAARALQKRSPKSAAGYALEGDVGTQRNDWPAAVAAYRAALQHEKLPEIAIKLHVALLAANRGAEASRLEVDWNRARPNDVHFLYYLGDVALVQKDFEAAEARYRTVLTTQPDNALALNNVAWLLARQGKPGAVALAERANVLLPDRAPLLDTLATALEADNRLPQAIDAQRRAVALRPKESSFSLHLARLYVKQGDKSRAKTELDALSALGEKFSGHAEVSALLKSL